MERVGKPYAETAIELLSEMLNLLRFEIVAIPKCL